MTIRITIDPDEDNITVEDEDENILTIADYLARALGTKADEILAKYKVKSLVYTYVQSR